MMGGVQIQESGKSVRKEKGAQRGRSLAAGLSRALLRAGAGRLRGSRAAALFLALMPAIQGSQEIGLGNSFKVITWDSGASRWLLSAGPQCSQRRSPGAGFRDWHCFHAYFWLEPELGLQDLSGSDFSPVPAFLWEEKKLAPLASAPPGGPQEAGSWKLPVKKTKPVAGFLACWWQLGREGGFGASIPMRISVWSTVITGASGSS